jgi:hypothetical protein
VSLLEGADTLEQRRSLAMNSFAKPIQLDAAKCIVILARLRQSGQLTVSAIVGEFAEVDRPQVLRGPVWLAKMEAVRIAPPSAA